MVTECSSAYHTALLPVSVQAVSKQDKRNKSPYNLTFTTTINIQPLINLFMNYLQKQNCNSQYIITLKACLSIECCVSSIANLIFDLCALFYQLFSTGSHCTSVNCVIKHFHNHTYGSEDCYIDTIRDGV